MTNEQKNELRLMLTQIIEATDEPEVYALARHALDYIEEQP
jgi:hypothetical protein